MKPFAIWLAAFVVVFGGFAAVTDNVREDEKVFVVVDSSFWMADVWTRVAVELDRIDDENYAEFALATEKEAIHGYEGQLRIGGVTPFAPCDFERIDGYAQVATADRLVFITTPTSCPADELGSDWEIIELEP